MKFWINIPDLDAPLCVQFVKRGGSVYARKCADTMFYPTEAQREVRTTLAAAAQDASGQGLNAILTGVRAAFDNWESLEKTEQNKVIDLLMQLYPEDTQAIMQYLQNR